jgi:hypothetical protein
VAEYLLAVENGMAPNLDEFHDINFFMEAGNQLISHLYKNTS